MANPTTNPTFTLASRGTQLLLNGEAIFTPPVSEGIEVYGHWGDKDKPIYAAAGSCCQSIIYELHQVEKATWNVCSLWPLGTGIRDILPVVIQGRKYDPLWGSDLLVATDGCSGTAIKLVRLRSAEAIDLVSGNEIHSFFPEAFREELMDRQGMPFFHTEGSRIFLDIYLWDEGFHPRAIKLRRSIELISLLVDYDKTTALLRGYSSLSMRTCWRTE